MKPSLPWVLSANGGYVDAAGFFALHGLFSTHVTGNFVTLGAALALGTKGALAKLLALPLFCVVVLISRIASRSLTPRFASLRGALLIKVLLLIAGAVLALKLGPFEHGDDFAELLTGMTLVAAMAVQNAVHRIYLGHTPPNTIMTGNTTQVMIDLADLIDGKSPEARVAIRDRAIRVGKSIATFAVGCALASLLYAKAGMWCFLLPPLIGAYALYLARSPAAEAAHGHR
jgi:uncharacterized membrane protein YoaK (UPF0700 family)